MASLRAAAASAVVAEFLADPVPTVADVHVSPEVVAPTYRRLFYGVVDDD